MKARIRDNIVHEACFAACDAMTKNKRAISDCGKDRAVWIDKPGVSVGAMADAVDGFVADWVRLMREGKGGAINERALRAAYRAYKETAPNMQIEWSLIGMHRAILRYLEVCQEPEEE